MNHESFYWEQEGNKIFAQKWLTDNPVATICIVHGIGEHSGRYQKFAEFLTSNNFNVIAYDSIGHGKSAGKRGHTPGFEFLLNSVSKSLEIAKELDEKLPVILYGQSMGGNLVVNYLLRKKLEIKCAIVMSPWLGLPKNPPAIQMMMAKLMINIYPAFTEKTKLDANKLSRIPDEVEKYVNDPLVHGFITAGFFVPLFESAAWAIEHAAELSIPTLLMHGTDDQITSFNASKQFAKKAGKKVEFKKWENGYHELLNDLEKEKVQDYLLSFLNSTLNLNPVA